MDESFSAGEMEEFQRRSREVRDDSVKPPTLKELQKDVSAQLVS